MIAVSPIVDIRRMSGSSPATSLFLALVVINLADLVFAVDSVPAIFAITTDPFIVFTSNIFAIMGLRALYFLLADMAERFHLLKYGLAIVLVFIGGKMQIGEYYLSFTEKSVFRRERFLYLDNHLCSAVHVACC